MIRRFRLAALALAVFLPFSGALAQTYYLIAHAGMADPFWQVAFRGASDAAAETGLDLAILAPETVNDYARQIALIDSAIAADAAGIATTVSDPQAFAAVLQKARDRGIPVIAFNARPVDDDRRRNPYQAYIGMDDAAAGRFLADHAWRAGALKDRVLVAVQQGGHAGLEARYQGIAEVLERHGLRVDRLEVGTNDTTTEQRFRDYVAAHDDLSGVITLGPSGAHPIGRVLKADGLPLYFASFDVSPLTVRMIKDGLMDATVDQQPYMQGYLAVKLLPLVADYRMAPPDINTGIGLIDAGNVAAIEKLARDHIR